MIQQRTLDRIVNSIDAPIDSDRFTILSEKEIGRGCWGKVYKAKDNSNEQIVAIKVIEPNETAQEQMAHRKLDLAKLISKESVKLAPCSNIVPRSAYVDNRGTDFIVMPFYEKFLSDALHDDSCRKFLDNGMSIELVLAYAKGIANGIAETHKELDRVHGDIKPDNIAIADDNKTALLSDFGTSTCASQGWTVSPRSNMGFLYTRAPECFQENSHPTKQADVWAFGSLLYRMLTGRYIFEDELENSKDPAKFYSNLDEKAAQIIINNKIKKAPNAYRGLLKECLAWNPDKRYYCGRSLKENLEKVIENMDTKKAFVNSLKKWAVPGVLGGLLMGLVNLAARSEPTELTMPALSKPGIVCETGKDSILGDGKPQLEFERETLYDLPKPFLSHEAMREESISKYLTKNRYAAYLTGMYMNAFQRHSGWVKLATPQQYEMWLAATTSEERNGPVPFPAELRAVAKSIELGIVKAKLPDGKIDLEDACAIARLGPDKVNEAKRASESFKFGIYIKAKYADGKYVIPENEQAFIKQWLAYIK